MNALPSHELGMTILMTPDMANFAGNVHGGHLLKLLDQVAYACASRYAGRYVVTVSVDQVLFRQPIHVGELVSFLAAVNHTGRSSMEVGIKVVAEDIHTQGRRHVNSCYFPRRTRQVERARDDFEDAQRVQRRDAAGHGRRVRSIGDRAILPCALLQALRA